MKTLFFVTSLNSGGLESYILRFLTHYKGDINATVICKSGDTGIELIKDFESLGVSIVPLRLGNFNLFGYWKLFLFLKKGDFESVCDFTGDFAAFPLSLAKKVGIKKRIVWYRNADVKFKKTFLRMIYKSKINKVVFNTATDILSNSQSAFSVFYKNYNWQCDNRFKVIYNGIDSEKFLLSNKNLRNELNIPVKSFVVGHIGRYNDQKNHKTAIEVAIRLCKEHNDIYFIFVGRGVDVALYDKVKDNTLDSKILLFGNRKDIPEMLNTFDCFYFPSKLEGNPNALIEAMITGLPFVASDIEPIRETVPEEIHPFLVPPLNISFALKYLLNIKNDIEFKSKLICKEWAIDRYNAKTQFGKFYEKL